MVDLKVTKEKLTGLKMMLVSTSYFVSYKNSHTDITRAKIDKWIELLEESPMSLDIPLTMHWCNALYKQIKTT